MRRLLLFCAATIKSRSACGLSQLCCLLASLLSRRVGSSRHAANHRFEFGAGVLASVFGCDLSKCRALCSMLKQVVLSIGLSVAMLFSWMSSVDGAVFQRDWQSPGDGLLTYDDVNRREWLDLSVSRLGQFPEPRLQNAIAQIAPGGLFDGFAFAKPADVIGLAESSGIDTGSFVFSDNVLPTDQLIDLLGVTFQSPFGKHSLGYVDATNGVRQFGADFLIQPTSGSLGRAGLQIHFSNDLLPRATTGLMLFRAVPEPATLSSFLLGLLSCATWFGRSRRGAGSIRCVMRVARRRTAR